MKDVAPDTEQGQHVEEHDDDHDTSHPHGHGPPDEEAHRLRLDVGDYREPGRGHPADSLEERVHEVHPGEQERQRRDQEHDQPDESDEDQTVHGPEGAGFLEEHVLEPAGDQEGEDGRREYPRILAQEQCDPCGNKQQEGEDDLQDPEGADGGTLPSGTDAYLGQAQLQIHTSGTEDFPNTLIRSFLRV